MAINTSGSQMAVNYTDLFPNTTDSMDNPNVSEVTLSFEVPEVEAAFKNPFEIIYLIVCFFGLAANGLSITATAHIPHGLTTHSKLIISLGVSDSLILIAEFGHLFTYVDSSSVECLYIIKRVLHDTAVLATLLNLLAMSGDHYMAIMKPLWYSRFMTSFRCNCVIFILWITSLFIGLLEVIVGGLTEPAYPDQSFCFNVSFDTYDAEQIMTIVIFIVLFVVVFFYTRIYFVVKRIVQHDQMLYRDDLHNTKATVTTMLIIGTFILFWTPQAIFKIFTSWWAQELYASIGEELRLTNDFLFLLLLLNSLADPLIYAIRLHEVQKGYKVLFYKCFPNRRFTINEEEFRNQHCSTSHRRRDTIPSIVNDNGIPSPDADKVFELNKKMEESSFIPDNKSIQ